jgi:hypothetical protein
MDMRRLSVVLLMLLIGALAPSAAQAASCLTSNVMPIDDVIAESAAPEGFQAEGLTVARGDDPKPFDVTVLGVLDDGVAVGVDMIIVKVADKAGSTDIADAKGIWAGMSGSPVYEGDVNGRFIGAVAYGLGFGPSNIGGLAAAEDMDKVMSLGLPAAAPRSVRAPAALRAKMVASGAVTAGQAKSNFERLPIPLGVSGLSSDRLQKFADRLPGSERFIPFHAGAGALAAAPGDPDQIQAGGNFATALSYGDITAAGIGTTTARCDDTAIAFGHPMNFDGPTALSVHNATAITIQDDPTVAPFKLANVGGVVGTLDQDRLSGIRGLLGAAPDPIEVTSTVKEGAAKSDDGLTNVNRSIDVPDIAAGHLLGNIDGVIDRIGGGRATVGWTVRGTAGGKQFSLTRNNKFADPGDISFVAVDEMFAMLFTLVDNPFAEVKFTDVDVDADVQAPFRAWRITGVEQRVGTDWDPIDGMLEVDPGQTIRVRALLAQDRSTVKPAPVEFSLKVPLDAAGREGSLDVTGGGGSPDEEFAEESSGEPQTFDQLVDALRKTPTNNEVAAELSFFSEESPGPVASARKPTDEVVSGGASVPVLVSGGEEPPSCEFPPCEEPPLGSPPSLNVGGKSAFKLSTALRRGLKLTVRSSEAGRITLKALVDRKTAKRLKLKKNAKAAVVVASASKRVHSGRNAVKLVFTKKARKRLRHAKRVKLSVRATIRSVEGNRATDRFKLTLKKKLR